MGKKTLSAILWGFISFSIGVYSGERIGHRKGYYDGLLDHTDSLNNQIDSLSYEYKKRLDELTRHSDTIEIRHTVFTLKPKQI